MGQLIGGLLAVLLLSYLVEWTLFQRILDDPFVGLLCSVATAVAIAIILYGFGNADGGRWNPVPGIVPLVFGGIIAAGIRIWWLKRDQAKREDEEPVG